jgi:hypothetical protein
MTEDNKLLNMNGVDVLFEITRVDRIEDSITIYDKSNSELNDVSVLDDYLMFRELDISTKN